jgi:hypothetical protein
MIQIPKRKIEHAIDVAKKLANSVSPGSGDVKITKPGQPVPIHHVPVPGFASGGAAKIKTLIDRRPAMDGNTSQEVVGPAHDTPTKSLAEAFKRAIEHHTSLPIQQRALNSKAMADRMRPYLGVDNQSGRPKPIITSNRKLVKAVKGYEAGDGYEASDPLSLPDGRGVDTVGVPLSPATEHGSLKICPNSGSCKDVCLGKTSGNYGASYEVNWPRINSARKTNAMLHDPEAFAVRLHDEIAQAKMQAQLDGNHLGVRLNTLSDLHPSIHEPIIKAHPDVTFYDYTKMKHYPVAPNHHYTYSSTGLTQPEGINGIKKGEGVYNPHGNWHVMRNHLEGGRNVAMVFSHQHHLPHEVHDLETDKRYRVVDGTTHDFRPLDQQPPGSPGVIVGLQNLTNKGVKDEAHRDSHGFVVKYDPQIQMEVNKRTGEPTKTPVKGPSPGRHPVTGKALSGPTIPTNRTVVIAPQPRSRPNAT